LRNEEESSSFLKKGTKKLLTVARCRWAKRLPPVPHATSKSFLVLFFKKELLPSFCRWSTVAVPLPKRGRSESALIDNNDERG
jgi:hypothetical protein